MDPLQSHTTMSQYSKCVRKKVKHMFFSQWGEGGGSLLAINLICDASIKCWTQFHYCSYGYSIKEIWHKWEGNRLLWDSLDMKYQQYDINHISWPTTAVFSLVRRRNHFGLIHFPQLTHKRNSSRTVQKYLWWSFILTYKVYNETSMHEWQINF